MDTLMYTSDLTTLQDRRGWLTDSKHRVVFFFFFVNTISKVFNLNSCLLHSSVTGTNVLRHSVVVLLPRTRRKAAKSKHTLGLCVSVVH